MQIFLIGHRGTGKTSLLQRLQIYGRGILPVFDLDREIERATNSSVLDLFRDRGETAFRELENEVLQDLIKRNPKMVCALGAGFPLNDHVFPSTAEIVWVRRASDARGRIFLDRPRLHPEIAPLDEYQSRFAEREISYARHCDWVYWIPEGLMAPCEFEKSIWGARLSDVGGVLTLRPDHFRNPRVFRQRISQIDADLFELRDDLLNSAELEMALAILPTTKILISLRTQKTAPDWQAALNVAAESDWALELGDEPEHPVTCVSLHEGKGWLASRERLRKFEEQGMHVKWSPSVENFADIERGLRWQDENPKQRSFLPRSPTGRWSWARLFLKDRQKFNFFRDGDGSALDQPTLHEWMRALSRPSKFAAVLGAPVSHSYSPIEHLAYARLRQMSFFAIEIHEHEWAEAMPVLARLGLGLAAVTSPLKKLAFHFADEHSEIAREFASANTLSRGPAGAYRAHNTDLEGFRDMVQSFPELGAAVVWGGGGTLPVIRKVLPRAQEVSARSGQARTEGETLIENPETLIWAAAPEAEPPSAAPWRPKQVLDLNYRDDSRAKEYAQRVGARYVSGLVMFHSQASRQREEWEAHG